MSPLARTMVLAVAAPLAWAPLLAACASGQAPMPAPAAAQAIHAGQQPIRWLHDTMAVTINLRASGDYVLTEDLQQRSATAFDEGARERGAPAVVLSFNSCADAAVDLGGHLVTTAPFKDAVAVANGLASSSIGDMGKPPDRYGRTYPFPHDLAVRNGRVVSPGASEGVGVFFGFASKQYPFSTGSLSRAYELQDEDATTYMTQLRSSANKITFTSTWNYQPATRFTVEKLQVHAGARGVIMTGAQNVLRDSTIEVDSDTAVYLYGPGTVVENNTIIVNMKPARPARLPAVLKLRDADGAVIRNNRLIVRGAAPGADMVGINLLASRDVLIEGNQVEGAPRLLRKDDESTVRGADTR